MSFVSVLFALVATNIFRGGLQHTPLEVRHALRHGAETKVVFHVVDDEGRPVKDASVGAAFYMRGKKGYGRKGLTDVRGDFTAQQMSVGEVNYWINKDGYYETHGRIWFAGDIYKCGEVKDGKWQPYGKTYEVVLKRIRNPLPMVVAPMNNWVFIPMTNLVYGFDFEKNDFVKPYGRGRTTDFTIEFQTDGKKYADNKFNQIIFRFIRPFDGFYRADCDSYSDLRSTYEVNTNAVFSHELALYTRYDEKNGVVKNEIKRDDYLVMRTRSEVDKEGRLRSAHYAKIHGDIQFGPAREAMGGIRLLYYYNPNLNDVRIEADPKKNRVAEGVSGHPLRRP